MPCGASSRDAGGRDVVPHDLAVDALLAHPAGDQLGVLRAEIEDQHALFGGRERRAKPPAIGAASAWRLRGIVWSSAHGRRFASAQTS